MTQSKKDNPLRAALLQVGNIRRSEGDVQESGAVSSMGRTRNKEDSQRAAIDSRRAEIRGSLRKAAINACTTVK